MLGNINDLKIITGIFLLLILINCSVFTLAHEEILFIKKIYSYLCQ